MDAIKIDKPMVSSFDSTITEKYIIKRDAKKNVTLTFVDHGFYEPILYEMFPVYATFTIIFFCSIYHCTDANPMTIVINTIFAYISGLGVTAGSHRLWTHKSYKASLCLKIFFAIGHTIGMQFSILKWSLIHVLHHKFSDTDADPHNICRGPLFAHFGWMCARVHPLVYEAASKIDFKDLASDKILIFQHKYKNILELIFAIFIPIFIPMYFYGECLTYSFMFCISRIHLTQNTTALVNSAAHMFGAKPYKSSIKPADNRHVAILTLGEGYHNFHHSFPFDYSSGEMGNIYNPTKMFVELMAFMGLASDLRSADKKMITKVKDANNKRFQMKG